MTYASLSQVKSALRLTDSVDDAVITIALNSADEAINAWCGRTFGTAGTVDATRYYAAGKPEYVEIDDCTSITSVATSTDGTTWTTTTDYQPEPLNNLADGMTWPYTRLRTINNAYWPTLNGIQTVRVVGKFAFGYVPNSVVQAAVLTTARWFRRADSPLGVAGFGDIGAIRVQRDIDPDVEVLLTPYRKFRGAL